MKTTFISREAEEAQERNSGRSLRNSDLNGNLVFYASKLLFYDLLVSKEHFDTW